MIEERFRSLSALAGRWHAIPREEVRRAVTAIARCMPDSGDGSLLRSKVFDATDATREDVIGWVRTLRLPSGLIHAYWVADEQGVAIELDDFLHVFDEVWFPGADDVWITRKGEPWVLDFDHEEKVTLWLLREGERGCQGANGQ